MENLKYNPEKLDPNKELYNNVLACPPSLYEAIARRYSSIVNLKVRK